MSAIEWTDATWNPAVGCTRVSPGCDHCYAMRLAHRTLSPAHEGLTTLRRGGDRPGVDWNGTVRLLPERLLEPLAWKRPRLVFVGSMTDLFHPKVPFELVAAVWAVMGITPHTYQVLTKRPGRALDFFAWLRCRQVTEQSWDAATACLVELIAEREIDTASPIEDRINGAPEGGAFDWPPKNVQLGTSVEDNHRWRERIPLLAQCDAHTRFVSMEPLLERVDLTGSDDVDWIIVGGESGPGARPFDTQWAADVIADFDGPVFVKQIGSRPVRRGRPLTTSDRKGGQPLEWPPEIRVRQWPGMHEASA